MIGTIFAFAMPSFLTGMARVVDLNGSLGGDSYVLTATPEEADFNAISSDWLTVGRDFFSVMDQVASSEEALWDLEDRTEVAKGAR